MSFFALPVKSHFNKSMLAGLLLLVTGPARAATLHEQMEVLQAHFEAIADGLGGNAPGLPQHAQAMRGVFEAIARVPSDQAADPLWRDWLDQSAAAAARLETALSAAPPERDAARAELKAIAALREKAHAHFRPGLLGRIERWFMKRRTRHHETSLSHPMPPPGVPGAAPGLRAP